MWLLGELPDVAVAHLVNPECRGCADEEQRKLDGDREQQDEVVDTVDRARRADTFECLPAERLVGVVRIITESISELLAYLHEPPAEEGGHEKSEDVEGQARDLSVRAALPVVGEEVDAARALRSQSAELLMEVVRIELEHRVGEHATTSELRIILTIWKPPQAVAIM